MGTQKDRGGGSENRLDATSGLAEKFGRNQFRNNSPGSRTLSVDYSPLAKPRQGERNGIAEGKAAGNVGEECLKDVKGSF